MSELRDHLQLCACGCGQKVSLYELKKTTAAQVPCPCECVGLVSVAETRWSECKQPGCSVRRLVFDKTSTHSHKGNGAAEARVTFMNNHRQRCAAKRASTMDAKSLSSLEALTAAAEHNALFVSNIDLQSMTSESKTPFRAVFQSLREEAKQVFFVFIMSRLFFLSFFLSRLFSPCFFVLCVVGVCGCVLVVVGGGGGGFLKNRWSIF
jgi:hypothetical protein